jgi:Acyl CoA:acetate/3-ketoacid CoA transferase, alpha subunit
MLSPANGTLESAVIRPLEGGRMAESAKVFENASAAIAGLEDGASFCVGGFGPPQNRPATLLKALAEKGPRRLTLIANGFSYQPLAENDQIATFIGAFGSSAYQRGSPADNAIEAGRMEFEACPQGILTERLRAGAAGIPAFYSPLGWTQSSPKAKNGANLAGGPTSWRRP